MEAIEHIFRAVTVWLAPVLVFTTEEAWSARDAAHGSIHLEQFPAIPAAWRDDELAKTWETIRMLRLAVTGAIEIARAEKQIGSSLEAAPRVYLSNPEHLKALEGVDFAEVCITSDIAIEFGTPMPGDGVSAAGSARRRRRRGARAGRQMRALVALLRSGDRFA